jgi:CBS domain-containing protein
MEIRNLAKEAVIVGEDTTFRKAISLMIEKETNTLLVVNEDGQLTGEVTVSDLLNGTVPDYLEPDLVLEELSTEEGFGKAVEAAGDKAVRDFMTTDIEPVHVDDTLLTITSTAIAYNTDQIPVVDHDNRPIGMISRRSLKHILAKYLDIQDNAYSDPENDSV